MFGFGKKKISAHKFAEISVPMSMAMASCFVDAWNSRRHHYEISALERNDQTLFEIFGLYNLLMHGSRHIVNLENPKTIEMFCGLVVLMYWQMSIDCGVAPPADPQYGFEKHRESILQLRSEYVEFSSDPINRRTDAFEELIIYSCRKLTGVNEKNIDFALEVTPILSQMHSEGWDSMKQRNEILLMNDETLHYFQKLKKACNL